MSDKFNLYWSGMLTTANVIQVANLFRQLLDGNYYTFVEVHEGKKFGAKVYTGVCTNSITTVSGQAIEAGSLGERVAQLRVTDTHGSWFCVTDLGDDQYDSEFNNPYILFEGNKVTIFHRCLHANEHRVCLVAVVEAPIESKQSNSLL